MGTAAATSAPVPRASTLSQLLDSYYETVKAVWEERFERRYDLNPFIKQPRPNKKGPGAALLATPRAPASKLVLFHDIGLQGANDLKKL